MQIKIILLCLLVILIMFVAIGISKQYKDKCTIYFDIVSFLNAYELNIGFKKEKMAQMVGNFKSSSCSRELFKEYSDYLNEGKTFNFSSMKLIEEDEEMIKEMFSSLGQSDYEQELKKVKNYKEYFIKQLKNAEEKRNKSCPLIIKLSFLFSLVIVILIV